MMREDNKLPSLLDELNRGASSMKQCILAGRHTFQAYCDQQNLPPIERRQHYTVTDLITDVLHYAHSRGWDVNTILTSAENHLNAETVEHCAKCGRQVTREFAHVSYGVGPEEGKTFYYCSNECRARH